MRQMKCNCGEPAEWIEMPPQHVHRYQVRCPRCKKPVKWGGVAELDRMIDEGGDETLVDWDEQKAPKLDPFAPFYKQ